MPTTNGPSSPAIIASDILPELIFDRMPMGIALLDREYRVLRYNPTWEDFSARYAPAGGAPLRPGVGYFEHLPGAEATVLPLYQRALAGETVRLNEVRLELAGKVSYWDVVLTPLCAGDQVVGMLNVTVDATERVLAQQMLEQRVEERTREVERRRRVAESLRDIIGMINAHLPLEEFLDRAVQVAAEQLGACACVLHHFDLDNQMVIHQASYGLADIFEKGSRRPFSALKPSGGEHYLRATLQRQPTYGNYPPLPERLEEIRRDPTIPEPVKAERIALRQRFAGSFSVPLFIQDKAYGGLVFYYAEPQEFSEEQIQLGLTFAEQMAIAIENAMLQAKSAQAAILAERNRLARDLHDAVTQTLFSASLIAEVLPKLWERNPETGRQKLEELRLLTRGALSEMRTLLLELRPDTLADVELGDLCRHLANAFSGRTRIPVAFTQDGQAALPPQVKETFYRVAQEALNNIAKHAAARQVQLSLVLQPDRAELVIRDDGAGFDPSTLAPENLGLKIMHERAAAIGAQLTVESRPGAGTCVTITWEEGRGA